MKSVRVEPLAPEHIPGVLEIERAANPAPWSETSFRKELENPQSVFLVALRGNQVVGFGGMWLVIDEAHITTLAVATDARRAGIGRALMIELLERAAARGMVCSTLEVRASNEPAIRLYEALGYNATARRKGYYPKNNEDAVVMWLHGLNSFSKRAS